jgi:hypothetical protein
MGKNVDLFAFVLMYSGELWDDPTQIGLNFNDKEGVRSRPSHLGCGQFAPLAFDPSFFFV